MEFPQPILISILSLLIILFVVFFVKNRKKGKMKNSRDNPRNYLSLIQFIAGIILALTGGFLMFFGILPSSARIMIGIVGIALIATSFRYKR
ncbi:MAG: hypothetical protein PHH00_01990 [Candidatus Nanoarchaeia archaeon]|nr:hypothetical protein [Candidatus Nanoarchaeia archaeon]